jgi:hypothetical protein
MPHTGSHEGHTGSHEGHPGSHEVHPGSHEGHPGSHEVHPGSLMPHPGMHEVHPGSHEVHPGSHEVHPGSHEGHPGCGRPQSHFRTSQQTLPSDGSGFGACRGQYQSDWSNVMKQRPTTIARRLHRAQQLILTTSRNYEIRALIAAQGYNDKDLADGQALYDAAVKAVQLQAAKAGGQRYATDQAQLAERAARVAYQNLVLAARAIFGPNTPERKALSVNGTMPTTTAAFLAAAITLFDNALNLPDIGANLARRGFDQARLQQGREALTHYQERLQAQASAKSSTRQAAAAQRAALTALHQWTGEYSAFATIALRERPDLLRELGITPRHKVAPPVPTP